VAEAEDEDNLLLFNTSSYKQRQVCWLAFFNVTQTNLAQSVQSYQLVIVAAYNFPFKRKRQTVAT
jgi:hypothetical protein